MRPRLILLSGLLLAGSNSSAADPRGSMLAITLGDSQLEGVALSRSGDNMQLLARDGRLMSLKLDNAKLVRQTTAGFRSYSVNELRLQLLKEFGKAFDVTATGHYLVVHPKDQKDTWSPRFETLYRHFVHYFSVRGFRPVEPEFPLVAIVWPKKQDFLRYASQDGNTMGANVLGYYSPKSNRITLYDVGGGSASSESWQTNADTIIHEATHQTAFNTGVHRRFAQTPRWLCEGLATMFEAPGVWKSEENRRAEDRINRGRLTQFKKLNAAREPGRLAEFLSSDRIFDSDPNRAYAEAWALSFFLSETQSRKYSDYLQRVAKRPAFQEYSGAARLADFTAIFGTNLSILETHYLKFINELK
jgi:hypothetical protein